MSSQDLVKVTVFQSDRQYREANYKVRHEVLGGHSPALTVIVAGVSNRGDRSHLYHYRRAGDRWIEIGRIPADPDQFQVGPLLSPKGDRLLFAQRHGTHSGEIFLIDLVTDPDRSWPPDCRNQAES